jgi:hypothetical protein
LSFNVTFSDGVVKQKEDWNLPVAFPPLLDETGGTLLPLSAQSLPEVPSVAIEMSDELNCNHLRFLFKYLIPRPCFEQRYPLNKFTRICLAIDLWPREIVRTNPSGFTTVQDSILSLNEVSSSGVSHGVLLPVDISLKTVDHVVAYFMQLKSNELQVQLIDCESGVVLGSFPVPSALLLRQHRQSLQFDGHANLVAPDGELLGSFHFTCGCYGTRDHQILRPEFALKNTTPDDVIISWPLVQTDAAFRELVKQRDEPRFELAAQYRESHRSAVVLGDLQRQFLRTITISPIPGVECRLIFDSTFESDEDMDITVQVSDERLRFVRVVQTRDIAVEETYRLTRDHTSPVTEDFRGPIEERLHLVRAGHFHTPARTPLLLEFAFLAVSEFEGSEIMVKLLDSSSIMLDEFTVLVRKTAPVVHENVRVLIESGNHVSATINTVHTLRCAIASTFKIQCAATPFGVKMSSKPIAHSMRFLVFLFDTDDSLCKIVRIHLDIVPADVLQVETNLQVKVQRKWIGSRVCCKSSDYRVAEFLSHSVPTVLREPGALTVRAISAGVALLSVWSVSDMAVASDVLIRVGQSKFEKSGQRCLARLTERLKIGESSKASIAYSNEGRERKTIRVTTSHPALLTFDPTHYEVPPVGKCTLRAKFLACMTVQEVEIHVFVQDTGVRGPPAEFYKFKVQYVEDTAEPEQF